MVDSGQSTDDYRSQKISIRAIIKTPEMLPFISDHLKTREICKHDVKTLPFVIRYVSDRYKTQQIYDKPVLENGGTLESV